VAELLCDLDFIKAEYERNAGSRESADDQFRVTLSVSGLDASTFQVSLAKSAQFAAELDVLASLIRARLLKAQLDSEGTR
jgi:hypothetical protein